MTASRAPLADDRVPLPRPHFRLREGALYFLISQRPLARLDAGEQEVWRALDGRTTVGELRARLGEAASSALRRFWDLGLCELAEGGFPGARRRVLVVEPHMDDAVLSVGGTMWSRRRECDFTVLTVAGRSNFTSYGYLDREYFDVEEVTALRRAESALFLRMLGGRHAVLDKAEAPQRYRPGSWTLEWYRRHRLSISAFIAHRSPEAEVADWAAAIGTALRDTAAEEIWLPLGVAPHTDHELTRNACLEALLAEPALARGRLLRLYQEAPYAAQFPGFTAALTAALTAAGARLEREVVPVADVFEEKLRLVSLFGSQFKLEALRPGIEASARAAAGEPGGLAELFIRLHTPPARLDPLSLYVDQAAVRRLADSLRPWLRRHRRARLVRVLSRVPAGRWATDVGLLLDAFPDARIEAHVAPGGLAEALEFRSPRVSVHAVPEGTLSWIGLAVRLAFSAPAPTLFLAGRDRRRQAGLLAALFPLSPTIVAPAMNHLASALPLAAAATAPPRSPAAQ